MSRPGSTSRIIALLLLLVYLLFAASCSPGFVIRAGWEEAGILCRRKKITSLLESPDLDKELKHKFELVLAARDFAEQIGLKPKGSFTKYSEIDREVLVWVLSASPKTSLLRVTWWFPIVGRIPYRGFFEKDNGIEAAKKLKDEGYDIYLRPSPAFSTLGWFDDPLLSTTIRYDEVSLVNTVIHEVLHNTLWVQNHASFNETLANVVGSLGAEHFFREHSGPESQAAVTATNLWHDELLYARFLAETSKKLRSFYSSLNKEDLEKSNNGEALARILEERKNLFAQAVSEWKEQHPELRTKRYKQIPEKLNNAVILAHEVYLDRPWVFVELYEACGNSLEKFVEEILALSKEAIKEEKDPFEQVVERTAQLRNTGRKD